MNLMDIVMAFLGSYCPAILFNIERKNLIWAGLCGALGWVVYSSLYKYTNNTVLSVMLASITISLYGELMARQLKTPATVFYIPSIFPLVPGISAYDTVLFISQNKLDEAMYKAVDTIATAGAIAFGIMLVSTIFHYINKKQNSN